MARSGGDGLKIRERWASQGQEVAESTLSQLIPRAIPRGNAAAAARREDVRWIADIPHCPVFTPTLEEFQDPLGYISRIAPEASKYGICKIVSPVAASVPAGRVLTKENPGFKFNTRVQPMRISSWDSEDSKVTFLTNAQRYTFPEFEKIANKFHARKFSSSAVQPPQFVEAEFWKEILSGSGTSIEYASDVDGSAFSSSANDALASSKWNLQVFSNLPGSTLRHLETIIPGVTEPMLYIGQLFSMFAWHVEDHYLYSINYQHCGASKTWYGVPGDAAQKFENVAKAHVYDSKLLSQHGQGAAYDLLIGKTTMFAPKVLLRHSVPVYKAVQAPGEFVLTFPRSYHAGFSHGFNCGEAVNFAMADWFSYGAAACRRYCLLNRMPLLPHEELLWKEVQTLGSMDERTDAALSSSFLRLMAFYHKVRWLLKNRGAEVYTLLCSEMNVACMRCKHLCYVAFHTCRCFPEPACLNHAAEMRKCECGGARRVFLHKEVERMDELAARLRQVYGDSNASPTIEDGMSFSAVLEEDMIHGNDYSRYSPSEKIEAIELNDFSSVRFSRTIETEPDAGHPSTSDKVKPGVAVRTMPSKRPDAATRERLRQCFVKRNPVSKDKNKDNERDEPLKEHCAKRIRATVSVQALLKRKSSQIDAFDADGGSAKRICRESESTVLHSRTRETAERLFSSTVTDRQCETNKPVERLRQESVVDGRCWNRDGSDRSSRESRVKAVSLTGDRKIKLLIKGPSPPAAVKDQRSGDIGLFGLTGSVDSTSHSRIDSGSRDHPQAYRGQRTR